LVRTTDITSAGHLTGEESAVFVSREDAEGRELQDGDLLFSRSGTLGRCLLYDGPPRAATFAAYLVRFRVMEGYDPRYIAYCAQGKFFSETIRTEATQSTIANFNAEKFAGLLLPWHSAADQRAIADFLDAETARVDVLIEKKQRMVGLLAERRMSMMTEGVAGLLTETSTRPSSLPWLPQVGVAWREVRLSLVARQGTGHTPGRDHPEWWVDCTIPWITTGEVAQVRSDRVEYISETREMISELGAANSSAEIHPAGTVVLCRTASAGYSAIMGTDMATSQDFATWTCGPLLKPRFLLLCLRAMRQDLLGRLAMGSTHKTIYMPDIEGLRIPLPPVETQDRIVHEVWSRLQTSDAIIEALSAQIDLLIERRQALITTAVTGELEVPGVAA
jgi:type I restriction enzyme S subunit